MSRRGRTARVASRQRVETLGNGTSAPTNKTIDKVETGELYFIDHNHASALTITLPPMQDGAYFKFIFKTALAVDGSVVIATSEATAGSIIGSIFQQVTGGSNAASGVDTDDGTDVKITLSDDIHPGSWVECFCDGSVWYAHARLNVDGVGESGFGEYTAPVTWTRMYVGLEEKGASSAPKGQLDEATIAPDVGPNAWTSFFVGGHTTSKGTLEVTYGKDGSGNPYFITLNGRDTKSLTGLTKTNFDAGSSSGNDPEIIFRRWADPAGSTNYDDDRPQTNVKQRTVAWGNNVWMSIGDLKTKKYIFRSVDGATWDPIIIDTLSEMPTGDRSAHALTTDGNGTWWFGVIDKLYKSTDNGLTWSLQCTFDVTYGVHTNGLIWDLVYTNDTLVCLYRKGDNDHADGRIYARAAPGSNTSTFASSDGQAGWGTEVLLEGSSATHPDSSDSRIMNAQHTKKAAAANGRVMFWDNVYVMFAEVDGSASALSDRLRIVTPRIGIGNNEIIGGSSLGTLTAGGTSGDGTWYIATKNATGGGDKTSIFENTNDGVAGSWVRIINGFPAATGGVATDYVYDFTVDRYLPL